MLRIGASSWGIMIAYRRVYLLDRVGLHVYVTRVGILERTERMPIAPSDEATAQIRGLLATPFDARRGRR